MPGELILWSHALGALFFGALGIAVLRGSGRPLQLPRIAFVAALTTTALWALSVAGIGDAEAVTRVLEGARDVAWLVLMLLVHRSTGTPGIAPTLAYTTVAAVIGCQALLYLAATVSDQQAAAQIGSVALAMRTLASVAALVLLHGLFSALRTTGARLALGSIGALWLIDVNVATIRYLAGSIPVELYIARGVAVAALAGVVAAGLHRGGERPVRVSRTVAFRSLSIAGLGVYLIAMVSVTSFIAAAGGTHARLLQTAFAFGSTAAIMTLVSSDWTRAWIKVKLSKHLFHHRYDYRVEWTRFTETLGEPTGGMALEERVVKAVADLIGSPAGLLLLSAGDTLEPAASWRWDELPSRLPDMTPLARHLAVTGRILEVAPAREGQGDGADAASLPAWMLADAQAWTVVPLPHLGALTGAILLAPPLVERALDWEDLDLLRIAGRQVASYLAEQRAQAALADARRFEEFNRRFAFILHDVKNLVSQLTLVARNSERHADNPAFRADMVVTLKEAAVRMNGLLGRLSFNAPIKCEPPVAFGLLECVRDLVVKSSAGPRIRLTGNVDVVACADPVRVHQLLDHLIQNALEASAPDAPVELSVQAVADRAIVDVIDRGCGMTPGFVRDQLFRPFASSKPTGFGIGAFEALQLARGMGGTLEVDSREGVGTCFRVVLPAATDLTDGLEKAA